MKITESEINQLCQLQSEITRLELELSQNLEQSTKELTKIIVNIQEVKGNVFSGSITTGNNPNFGNINNQNINSTIQNQNNCNNQEELIESLIVQQSLEHQR